MLKRTSTSFACIILFCSFYLLITGCDTKRKETGPVVKQAPATPTPPSPPPVITAGDLKLKKPTIRWERMMSEGDDFYTPEDIRESNRLLDRYLTDLIAAKDTVAIWKAVEVVVTGFDKLNLRTEFIETGEREELAEFIQQAAEVYGLKHDGDITEKWRMEW